MKQKETRDRLQGLSVDELKHELAAAEQSLLNYQFDAGLKRLTNPAGMHDARKQIARVKTILRQRELLANAGVGTMDEYKAYKTAERIAFRDSRRAR